jgi:hypothetical protein
MDVSMREASLLMEGGEMRMWRRARTAVLSP